MMKKDFKETSKTGAVIWLLQRISAVILFVILIIHFVTYHFISQGLYPWKEVVAKMQSPWFNLFQFIFLVSALFHGLNGVWIVAEDYIHDRFWRIVIYSLILLVGISLLFIGTVTIIKISSLDLTKVGI
ncbi:MAG TPA: succinate dehydrogenase, hydrophobic membrane anchor protein [Candidatus Deferrimicrobium sp.]|nr:succinate dehydrogenase, hydrophobic membrane anchor protein [Candidatus Deferrimicrobium sp.]